jgi:hypothetical protein
MREVALTSHKVGLTVKLLQLRVLRLGFFQDGDFGVGVFPEREEGASGRERESSAGSKDTTRQLAST